MALPNVNPTTTPSWKKLQSHFEAVKDVDTAMEAAKVEVLGLLKQSVRPEFLNRIDDIIFFCKRDFIKSIEDDYNSFFVQCIQLFLCTINGTLKSLFEFFDVHGRFALFIVCTQSLLQLGE